jgi:hypothetical protein
LGGRRAAGALLTSCALVLLGGGVAAVPAQAVTDAAILAAINTERQANGLPLVREDAALSTGCAQYDNYRRLNGSVEDAFTLHGESTGSPGFTPTGAAAASHSLLNAGDRTADSFAAGDVFDDAPNHLVALMDPSVSVVGVDQTDFSYGLFGTVHLVCIDVRSAPARAKPRRLHVYIYRGPRGRVPVHHLPYREGPMGQGSLVALYFAAPPGARVTLRSLKIRGPGGVQLTPSGLTVGGGLLYAPRRARRAIYEGAAKSGTPRVDFRAPSTSEQSFAETMRSMEEADHRKAEAEEQALHEELVMLWEAGLSLHLYPNPVSGKAGL